MTEQQHNCERIDWISHFLIRKREFKKLESQETEITLKLDGIDIKKICLIDD